MRRTARVLISLAWFAAISLIASAPTAPAVADTVSQPGPCFYYNGVYFCLS